MRDSFLLAFTPGVEVRHDGADIVLAATRGPLLRLRQPDAAVAALVGLLEPGGRTADELCDAAVHGRPGADYARLYFILGELGTRALLRYTVASNGRRLASLEPASRPFRIQEVSIGAAFRLSRFACMRRSGDEVLLESPLAAAIVWLHDSAAATAVASLVEPRTAAELASTLGVEAAAAFVSLLVSARAAFPCDGAGRIAEDDNIPLRHWQFHDLLFHTRSRLGRHGAASGGTFRFAGELPPVPAVKPPMSERRIALHTPDLAALDADGPSFSRVIESRRSQRNCADRPISAAELGEFLYRVARVKAVHPANPGTGDTYEISTRPCPAGGAMHEIELYLTVHRCDGIEPGHYHYAPLAHELEHVATLGALQRRLLEDACGATGMTTPPDVLITLAARFQRVMWKYEAMAYALMLKNAGVLYQQMYLVATAMDLAPCGLGGGDSDAFAGATGLDYYAETSVGEFLLGSREARSAD